MGEITFQQAIRLLNCAILLGQVVGDALWPVAQPKGFHDTVYSLFMPLSFALLCKPISLCHTPACSGQQTGFHHLTGNQVSTGTLNVQKLLQIFIGHLAILGQIVQHHFHLRRDLRRRLYRCRRSFCRLCAVHIGKDQLEGVGRDQNTRLLGAVLVEFVDTADACTVRLNQFEAMENLSQVAVARLRNTTANILHRKARQQATQRDKFHAQPTSFTLMIMLPLKL